MAGLILREDIDEVRSRARLDDIIGEYVTLRSAGVGSMKGLCPFHDERTPSFHVRPQVGMYHCFGCGESGDVFTFLQKIDGLTFTEAVQRLSERVGVQLRYEEGGTGPDKEAIGQRQRLVDMHQVAQAFFTEYLDSPEAQIGRQYLTDRGFDKQVCETYGIGFAPRSWDALLKHLRGRGYNTEDIIASGLVSQGNRGIYDRFRGRLMWPINDVTGRTVGFGARKVFDDDQGPKYLNTPETALYRKNQVLYGLDIAKRPIARSKRVVIVEGYTDVMAAHLAGVEQAVATCGTAFGTEHIKLIRRLLGDDSAHSGEVIFTFDGDEAGRKAALKAFEDDQKFVAQTFVAIAEDGMDPCDLRIQKGDAAVRALIESRRPLFEFAITSTIERFDLDTAEGRVGAVRAAAPMVAGIRDSMLRPEYERFVAGAVGVDTADVHAAVRAAGRRAAAGGPGGGQQSAREQRSQYPQQQQRQQPQQPPPGPGSPYGDPAGPPPGSPADQTGAEIAAYEQEFSGAPANTPKLRIERGALQVAMQQPQYVNATLFDGLNGKVFSHPAHRAVHQAMKDAGGIRTAITDPASWPEKVLNAGPDQLRGLIGELAVTPLPATDGQGVERYSRGIIASLFDEDMTRIARELHSRLSRTDPNDPAATKLLEQLQVLERQRARLRALM
ncbi:DNA primase [Brevibacterium gallinarum]|uniref:DNA primase n=1 Tax=Brevibacterium gallinarum TaxID=2762220 RepID=A0ABR8WSS1_9MICO|nr:DNA primase [Brevibacterium gallinarum]MBD8020119.1 DNA primase [Brevibacterium gallinarum]